LEVVEEHRAWVHGLEEVLARGLAVLVALDLAVRTVAAQHRAQRVVVHRGLVGRGALASGAGDLCGGRHAVAPSGVLWVVVGSSAKNRVIPSRTCWTSRGLPMSSNRYIRGTWHFAEMILPAAQ